MLNLIVKKASEIFKGLKIFRKGEKRRFWEIYDINTNSKENLVFLSVIQELDNLFCASYAYMWNSLNGNNVKLIFKIGNLNKMSDNDVRPLKFQFPIIYKNLHYLVESTSIDLNTRHFAELPLKKVDTFSLICSFIISNDVLC